MKTLWVSLYHNWSVQNVQAGLTFIIHLLCIGGTFVLVRLVWLRAARQVARNKHVPAYNLLSLNTVGETIDITWLLRGDLFQPRYRGLLLQCVCVVTFAAVGVVASFLASFSTRPGTTTKPLLTAGVLALRTRAAMEYAGVELNNTYETLKRAQFPQTQLLEFWPDTGNWVYHAEQWNSSWSMKCQHIRSTPVENPQSVGNCTDSISSSFPQFPQFYDAYQDWLELPNATFYILPYSWASKNAVDDHDWLVMLHGVHMTTYDQEYQIWTELEVRMRMYYLQNVPFNETTYNDTCWFGVGPVGSAFFTGTTCLLERDRGTRSADDLWVWGAYPEGSDLEKESMVLGDYFGDRWALEVTAGRDGPVTEGEEMAMLYQAYQITKDTNGGRVSNASGIANAALYGGVFLGNSRKLDIRLAVPQVSVPCLVVCAVAAVIVLAGLITYFTFKLNNRERLERTPESKLDWMLQTLHQEAATSRLGLRAKFSYSALPSTQQEDVLLADSTRTSRNSVKGVETSVTAALSPLPISPGDESQDSWGFHRRRDGR